MIVSERDARGPNESGGSSIVGTAPQRTAEESRHISRLMLFFAIVYVVEGIGQARVGVIFQPLNNYLKVIGWTPVQVTAYLAILNFPWIIKPVFGLVSDFVPLFGYRRKSYLILSSICVVGAYSWIARLGEPRRLAVVPGPHSDAMAPSDPL